MAIFPWALIVTLVTLALQGEAVKYQPNWDSLDKRPLPQWYDDAKFGIFIHWGVFSVPSFGDEWFWNFWHGKIQKYVDFMKNNYRPGFTYQDFAAQFTAEFYDANHWADVFKSSGARYIVLTSKHHEGFTNWPSKASWNWNAMDVGPKRDLVGELAAAIRNRTDIHFGLYHSLFEWFNPLFLSDKKSNYSTQDFVSRKTMPELYELVNAYKPEVVWSDGSDGPDTYWNATEFIAWLYNESPVKDTVVVNDRWGNNGIACKHGDFWTCHDRYNPGKLQNHKWENCMTIDCCSWGYRRDAQLKDYLSVEKLVTTLIETVSYGGNLLMNVGPTHDGRIMPLFEERLKDVGDWLQVNGEAIYATRPWSHQNDTVTPNVWYTSKKGNGATDVYALFTVWPKTGVLTLGAPQTSTAATQVNMLGYNGPINWKPVSGGGMNVIIPAIPFNQMPSTVAWAFKITNLKN